MDLQCRIAHGYFFAKNYIISKGFSNEVDWQETLEFDSVTEQVFLEEFAWVVLASGMNDKVVRKVFPKIKSIMYDFASTNKLIRNKKRLMLETLKIFNHKRKIEAIFYTANYIETHSFEFVKSKIVNEKIDFIQTLPYMGKATSFHLAKNLGINIAKPDRHLIRIATALGFVNPNELCMELSATVAEKASLIDLVIWRYATLDNKYLNKIAWLIKDIK